MHLIQCRGLKLREIKKKATRDGPKMFTTFSVFILFSKGLYHGKVSWNTDADNMINDF